MNVARLEEHFDKEDFVYRSVLKAWATINGNQCIGKYFFIVELLHPPFENTGNYMAFLRRPNQSDWKYDDVPFDSDKGFREEGDAEAAIFKRVRDLGWRIEEINPDYLPIAVDCDTRALIQLAIK